MSIFANKIGIMQGRLSTLRDKVQTFPWDSWQSEFERARSCEFDSIEWLFDAEDFEHNPIWTRQGRETVSHLITTTGIRVRSVCATYFMTHPFFRVEAQEQKRSVEVLLELIPKAASLGVSVVLIPLLEDCEIRSSEDSRQLHEGLAEPLKLAEEHNIRIGLETELPALEFLNLIEEGRNNCLGTYYDAGNATAKGYDVVDDIRLLAPVLCGIHLKDRKVAGKSFPLGQGDTDFVGLFETLDRISYTGTLILETPVTQDPVFAAQSNLNFVRERLSVFVK